MQLLYYNELQVRRNREQFERVCKMLQDGNFAQAEVKRLSPSSYYRAKLNDSDRLLFSFVRYKDEKIMLALEIIYNHEYDKSRFLRGAQIDEAKIEPLQSPRQIPEQDCQDWVYRHPSRNLFHLLDRPISFDEVQEQLYNLRLPLIMVGSAGSGKTVLSLEKLKSLPGEILYVTRSAYLADNARGLYSAYDYDNPKQNVDFLSFEELLCSFKVPDSRKAEFGDFLRWYRMQPKRIGYDAHQLYEEFSGVLTGLRPEKPSLELEDYLELGVKQSIFQPEQREEVFLLFSSWLAFLKSNRLYSENILSHEYAPLATAQYDYMVVDEVQDLTNTQLQLLLKCLKNPVNFMLCGDSNQIVHPNFFSWSAVKSLFFRSSLSEAHAEIKILHANYRNAQAVTDMANQLLRIKFARFGSIDRESNYLVDCVSSRPGQVSLLEDSEAIRRELNEKTSGSVHFAVLVLRDEDKQAARLTFKTPLVFSIREAKGLEYRNIVIYNLVSGSAAEFDEVCAELRPDDLVDELQYRRNKDKSDKSLEIYKFFVNSLYVALTRAIENIYWLERSPKRRLFRLLGLSDKPQKLRLQAERSSLESWRKEANKLEAQGNKEQAEQIQRQVLKTEKVPWEVISRDKLPQLYSEALDRQRFNKQAKQKLLNYGVAHDLLALLRYLEFYGMHGAARVDDCISQYNNAFMGPYKPGNRKNLLRDLQRYGVDFRDGLNRTPLMLACQSEDLELSKYLLEQEANPLLCDNQGRMPFHYLLKQLHKGKNQDFLELYKKLEPPALNLRVGDKQFKLGSQSMEFFIVNLMLVLWPSMERRGEFIIKNALNRGFTSSHFMDFAGKLPDYIMPAYRKKRSFISGILSKNEINSSNPYCKQLFYRCDRGNYLLSPHLKLQQGSNWLYWDELVDLHLRDHYFDTLVGCCGKALLMRSLRQGKNVTARNMDYLYAGIWETAHYRDYYPSQLNWHTLNSLEPLQEFITEIIALYEELPSLPPSYEELKELAGKKLDAKPRFFYNQHDFAEQYRKMQKYAKSKPVFPWN